MPASGDFKQSPSLSLILPRTLRVSHAAEPGLIAPLVTWWLRAALGDCTKRFQ